MRKLMIQLFSSLGIGITRAWKLAELREGQDQLAKLKDSLDLLSKITYGQFSAEIINKAFKALPNSTSQLNQDLVALLFLDFKREGYFVEFGATDGISLSNTYMLEKDYGWRGILAEPGKRWQNSLEKNRNAIIETRCVWEQSGVELEFNETKVGELSTLEMFSDGDMHSDKRISGKRYLVQTTSLIDLLEENDAPKFIDYLSVDTEGSEYEILKEFNFNKFTFGFISCEHNYTPSQERVERLLISQGYIRVFEEFSFFDGWYVHNSLIKS